MNNRITFLLCALLMIVGMAMAQHSCCPDPTYAFAKLADNPAFVAGHDIPGSYVHVSHGGKMISYDTKDGKKANAFLLKSHNASDLWLIVVHEWWGLNDYIKRESDKFSGDFENVNVLAIDLYDGNVASNREDAKKYMQMVNSERAMNIIDGAIAFAGKNAKIATIGWCFGGGWSLQSAIRASSRTIACVMYYGMPESDIDKLKQLNGAPVLGVFANLDHSITPAIVDEFKANMNKAGQSLEVKQFDAAHAFANPSSDSYNGQAAQEAYKITNNFLEKAFQTK